MSHDDKCAHGQAYRVKSLNCLLQPLARNNYQNPPIHLTRLLFDCFAPTIAVNSCTRKGGSWERSIIKRSIPEPKPHRIYIYVCIYIYIYNYHLTSKVNSRTGFPSYLLIYFPFICLPSRCTPPDFPSIPSLASLPFLSCCHRTTTCASRKNMLAIFASVLTTGFYIKWGIQTGAS